MTDKGYHSRAVVSRMAEWGLRTYCSEPNRGRQKWQDLRTEQAAVVSQMLNSVRSSGADAQPCYAAMPKV